MKAKTIFIVVSLFISVFYFTNLTYASSCQKPNRPTDWTACYKNYKKAENFCDPNDLKYNLGECDKCCGYFKNVACKKPSECKILKNPPKVVTPTAAATGNRVSVAPAAISKPVATVSPNVAPEDQKKQQEESQSQQQEQIQILKKEQSKDELEVRKIENETLVKRQEKTMLEFQSRNSAILFLFGPSYSNLGKLRSEIAKNEAQIEKMESMPTDNLDEEGKLMVKDAINQLVKQQENIKAIISESENKFSLFGWFFKFFYSD
jgi:hypothetical protein